jgi:hypothetical protein
MELDASIPCSATGLCPEQNESSPHSHTLVLWDTFWYVIPSRHASPTLFSFFEIFRLKIYKKVKLKLSLCLINYALRHENVWGSGGIAPVFLTSALDGASRPGRFITTEKAPLHIGWEAWWAWEPVWTPSRREILFPLPGIKLRPSSP